MGWFHEMRENVAGRLLSVPDLQELRGEIETDIRDARLGAFLNNDEVIAEGEKEIVRVDKELARRQVARHS